MVKHCLNRFRGDGVVSRYDSWVLSLKVVLVRREADQHVRHYCFRILSFSCVILANTRELACEQQSVGSLITLVGPSKSQQRFGQCFSGASDKRRSWVAHCCFLKDLAVQRSHQGCSSINSECLPRTDGTASERGLGAWQSSATATAREIPCNAQLLLRMWSVLAESRETSV